MEEKPNKVTDHLSEVEKQELYKNARAKSWYDGIWQNVGKCVFCDLKDKYILHEENGVVLTINIYPYIDGQMMAIPRRHIGSPKELTPIEWETMRKFSYLAKKMIKKVHGHKGMWSVLREGAESAQMSVAGHIHMQFIPFDAPDLCQWNYRELKNTPLENVEKYKKIAKKIAKYDWKFQSKYQNKQSFPVVLDLIIINKKSEVLLQERTEKDKFYPDVLTLPGGHIDHPENSFFSELQREVKEEIGYEIDTNKIQLVDSRLSSMRQKKKSKYSGQTFLNSWTFVWNTYILRDFDEENKLVPMDDCKKLVWMNKEKILQCESITPGLKKTLMLIFDK